MATKPTDYPVWASDDTTLPSTGESNKEQPKTSLQTTGWDNGEIPTAEEFNWQLNNIDNWVEYFDSVTSTNSLRYFTTDTGSANAYVVAVEPAITALVDEMEINFKALAANTGASTLNANSIGAKTIYNKFGAALTAGEIATGSQVTVKYNSTTDAFYLIDSTIALPTVPTASTGTSSTQTASTAFVANGLALKANIASPTLTGTPAAPTATTGTSTTQLATTAFVNNTLTAAQGESGSLIPNMSYFTSSLGTSGYQRLPGGFYIMWGTTTIAVTVGNKEVEGSASITFPTTFPNAAVSIQASVITEVAGGTCETCRPTALSTTGAGLRAMSVSSDSTNAPTATTVTVYWQAIGY